MTVEAIKAAIVELPDPDRRKLVEWFDELEERAWDEEMRRDFSPGGPGHHLVEKVYRQIDEGDFAALEDGLHARQNQV
jgi:hypothetical protein